MPQTSWAVPLLHFFLKKIESMTFHLTNPPALTNSFQSLLINRIDAHYSVYSSSKLFILILPPLRSIRATHLSTHFHPFPTQLNHFAKSYTYSTGKV